MNKTKIELHNLAFFARHGVLQQEAQLGQRFKVDVWLTLVDGLQFAADCPTQTVDYVEVYALVKDVFEGQRFNLIERAATVIAAKLLEHFDKVMEVTVRVKKPSVPVDCICDYFAAEVTRCR